MGSFWDRSKKFRESLKEGQQELGQARSLIKLRIFSKSRREEAKTEEKKRIKKGQAGMT